jgi:TolB protein
MLRWAALPVVVFALAFAGSLAYWELDDGGGGAEPGGAAEPAGASERLVMSYSATGNNPDQGSLGSVRLDGSDLQNVIESSGSGDAASVVAPLTSPDGRTVAFQRGVPASGHGGAPFIYVIPLDGSKPERRVTGGKAPEVDPAWSPDGKRIVFARRVKGRFDLFSCATDGSQLARLTSTAGVDELSPDWSPDGSEIVFSRYESGFERGSGDLWTVTADGQRERLVLGDEHDYSGGSWSTDGRRFALLKDSLASVAAVDGSRLRPLTRAGEFKDTRPRWSPDGTRIAFARDPGKILTVRPDGSELRRVPFDKAANGVDWVPKR